jgi:hypothetical protein
VAAAVLRAAALPAPALQRLHQHACRARDAEQTRHFHEHIPGLPLYPIIRSDRNGVRLEPTARIADEYEMLEESSTAHARPAEWTAGKEQWRRDRAAGRDARPPKPAQHERPEAGRGQ